MAEVLADVRRYAQLKRKADALESDLETVKAEARVLEEQLLDIFAENSTQSMNIDGQTVYLHRQIWAKRANGAGAEDVVEGLRKAGLDHMVTESANSNTLSALLRDYDREGQPIPEPLAEVVEATEVFSLRVRRS